MKKKILVLFSGGIDSTGLLYKCLTDSKYKKLTVHAHHIHLINLENRDKAEAIACKKIVQWLRDKNYQFEYTESTVDLSMFKSKLPWDTEVCWCIAGLISQMDYSIKYASTGRNATDHLAGGCAGPQIRERNDKLFENMTQSEWRNHESVKNLPVIKDMSKKEVWDLLPKELQEMVWYCRNPIYINDEIKKCCICPTCREVGEILKGKE